MKLAYQAAVTKLQAAFRKQLQVADLRATTTSPSAKRLDENCNIGINVRLFDVIMLQSWRRSYSFQSFICF